MYNKILLYTAVLRPIITYGSPVWGYAADANLKILEVTQNSLIRNIVKTDRYTRNRFCNHVSLPHPLNQSGDSHSSRPIHIRPHLPFSLWDGETLRVPFPSDDERPTISRSAIVFFL
ncbi:hypothetical protein TNCV_1134661 [Trichonephila clavipes]|nr:hypothetical protein TNCV_1134661 [Trichonephila clavipes]